MHVFRIAATLPNTTLDELDAIAIRSSSVKSHEELQLAEYLAKKAISQGNNVAHQLRYEFLLWLTGKTDIKSALATTSPRKNEDAIIISFADKPQLGVRPLALNLKTDAEPLDIERISLSRAKN